jgi:D-glycero-alpha-D-manno-heptose-7-phosphate kinase
MIVVRSPLRICLGGGGTDLPSYYREHGGFLLAASIDKYVYVGLHTTFDQKLIIKYSRVEETRDISEVQHPYIREALRSVGFEDPHLEIVCLADVPAGTGLGSSGSFLTALLMALHEAKGRGLSRRELAEQACTIEIDILGRPAGKQDPYVAAFGGLNTYSFRPDGEVEIAPLNLSPATRSALEDNLVLFFTGYTREAALILKDQRDRSRAHDPLMAQNLHLIKDIAHRSLRALESGRLGDFAGLMNEHWEVKKHRSAGISSPEIERWRSVALANGALGGKLIGAGGGGFLMLYAEEKARLRGVLKEEGLREVPFRFDDQGTKVVLRS